MDDLANILQRIYNDAGADQEEEEVEYEAEHKDTHVSFDAMFQLSRGGVHSTSAAMKERNMVTEAISTLCSKIPTFSTLFAEFVHCIQSSSSFCVSWQRIRTEVPCAVLKARRASHEIVLHASDPTRSVRVAVSEPVLKPMLCLANLPSFGNPRSDVFAFFKSAVEIQGNFQKVFQTASGISSQTEYKTFQ
jgi:hypothetical protein